jgi:hypothetical protein
MTRRDFFITFPASPIRKVVAELPGAEKESIQLRVDDGIFTIGADGRGPHVTMRAELPPVNPATMKWSFRNGVLEITFTVPTEHKGEKIRQKNRKIPRSPPFLNRYLFYSAAIPTIE